MASFYDKEIERLQSYTSTRSRSLQQRLGNGQDGIVYLTDHPSAVKALSWESLYIRERDVYLRFKEREVSSVGRFSIPQLIDYDDELWVVEMSVVVAPFVVDFAGAYLDQPPPYSDDREIMSQWQAERRELFGSDWSEVRSLMSSLKLHGVYLADVKPGNVTL